MQTWFGTIVECVVKFSITLDSMKTSWKKERIQYVKYVIQNIVYELSLSDTSVLIDSLFFLKM